jgi:hypothetical protein
MIDGQRKYRFLNTQLNGYDTVLMLCAKAKIGKNRSRNCSEIFANKSPQTLLIRRQFMR